MHTQGSRPIWDAPLFRLHAVLYVFHLGVGGVHAVVGQVESGKSVRRDLVLLHIGTVLDKRTIVPPDHELKLGTAQGERVRLDRRGQRIWIPLRLVVVQEDRKLW